MSPAAPGTFAEGSAPENPPDALSDTGPPYDPLPEGLGQRGCDDARPLVLVTLLCAAPDRRDRAIALHRKRLRHRTVFVVTDPDIAPIRSSGFAAEYLPAPEIVRRAADLRNWHPFLVQRWSILRAKWEPDFVVTAGVDFSEYLRACGFSDKLT
jgi:hypothetical protein